MTDTSRPCSDCFCINELKNSQAFGASAAVIEQCESGAMTRSGDSPLSFIIKLCCSD